MSILYTIFFVSTEVHKLSFQGKVDCMGLNFMHIRRREAFQRS